MDDPTYRETAHEQQHASLAQALGDIIYPSVKVSNTRVRASNVDEGEIPKATHLRLGVGDLEVAVAWYLMRSMFYDIGCDYVHANDIRMRELFRHVDRPVKCDALSATKIVDSMVVVPCTRASTYKLQRA